MAKRQKKKQNNTLIYGAVGVLLLIVIAVLALPEPAPLDTVVSLPLDVSVQEAFAYREEGAFILDVRTPEEWEEGHVPGATLIPLDELESRMAELPQDEDIVVICRSGNRSAVARNLLLDAGFGSVASVTGGFNQWAANDYPVEFGP